MFLVLFDIDGTLTDTFGVDTECFVQSLRDEFSMENINTDWSTYPDATDSAIFGQLFQARFRRPPTAEETTRMVDRFLSQLVEVFRKDWTQCRPVPGGVEFVETLLRGGQFAIGLVTGGWECSAKLKLRVAGYNHQDMPMATANDASQRREICSIAVERALRCYGVKQFEQVVYIGDGVWDARTAHQLGFRFIGRGTDDSVFDGSKPDLLISDFTDPELLGTIHRLLNSH